ncbi:hypothetical protein ACFO1V_10645 [Daeguia caeni]|uniref:Uncharacterized protein n=1 Tax=Daeguia caeni TaxID=439612 RepID=A0ABV9H823_9HYPH
MKPSSPGKAQFSSLSQFNTINPAYSEEKDMMLTSTKIFELLPDHGLLYDVFNQSAVYALLLFQQIFTFEYAGCLSPERSRS